MLLTTLCYIEKDDKYLMLHRVKKEHDVNKDKWIGIGGKFEFGESPEDCLIREAHEEINYTLTNYKLRGIITFIFNPLRFTKKSWVGSASPPSKPLGHRLSFAEPLPPVTNQKKLNFLYSNS